ncbi:MAG: LysE type translocator [Methanosaeta sp. PtaB.Bin018]|nr:LysE family transporter [Methanothrix sp.]OPX75152.1 MAG: LysE type translocator [Methanosaeta sp. PtaB.Bin018]OPY47802.1 MAG: LysE type translocator [Methanosaeta sp. PtaU1.Bin016]
MYEMIEMLAMSFTIGLTGALAPGPTLVATINSSLECGWTAGPKVAAGHALVEAAIFSLIVCGLALAMQQYSRFVCLLGGLALIAFGVLTMNASRNARISSQEDRAATNPYLAGMLTSVANPYFWIWWLSVGSALVIDGLRGGMMMAGLFMIGHWGADFGWYMLVSLSMSKGRDILSQANYRRILALCGGFLVSFGIYYLVLGID